MPLLAFFNQKFAPLIISAAQAAEYFSIAVFPALLNMKSI